MEFHFFFVFQWLVDITDYIVQVTEPFNVIRYRVSLDLRTVNRMNRAKRTILVLKKERQLAHFLRQFIWFGRRTKNTIFPEQYVRMYTAIHMQSKWKTTKKKAKTSPWNERLFAALEMIVKMNMQMVMKCFNVFALRKLLNKDH